MPIYFHRESTPELLPRSRLAAVPMEDQGSGLVASLASLMAHTACGHGLSTGDLITHELTPELDKMYMRKMAMDGGTRFYENSAMVLGVGQAAIQFAETMARLTGLNKLNSQTMLPWSTSFPSRNLIRAVRAWCPRCYAEWQEGGKTVYDPLVWSLQAVTVCPVHCEPLQTLCPDCLRSSHQLERKYMPGFCSHCQAWLGLGEPSFVSPIDERFTISKMASEIIALGCGDLDYRVDTTSLLEDSVTRLCGGNYAEFARIIGVSKSTLWGWAHGKNLIPLPCFLKICAVLGKFPYEFVAPRAANSPEKYDRGSKNSKLRIPHSESVGRKLREHLAAVTSVPPPSLRKVARELNTSPRMLRHRYREEARAIAKRYLNYRRCQKIEILTLQYNEVCRISKNLIEQGIYPTRKLVESAASSPDLLRRKEVRVLWRKYINDVLRS